MSLHTESFTLGVEEEYQIIDPVTRELSSTVSLILPQAQMTLGDAVQYEMILSQIEIATPVCHTLSEVRAELSRLRYGVITAAHDAGKLIGAAGTHPFSQWSEQTVTPKPRYEDLIAMYQQPVREQIIFGCHVHVGIPDRDVATQVLNHARVWLAPLLALTSNSPFWQGKDTGYANYRNCLWWSVPLSGPPPCFTSYNTYRMMIKELVDTGTIEDATRIYWDLRLSEQHPTIEFRVMDVCQTLNETVAIAGLIRAIVRKCYRDVMERKAPLPISQEMLRAAHWRAARYGLEGDLIDVHHTSSIAAHQLIIAMLEFLRPDLEAEDDWHLVSNTIHTLLTEGNGARKQRDIYKQTGNLNDVVDAFVAETGRL
ncbi:MAG TPA: carboxylate-amine ligase [Dictyobacter sp.]|jgi:carboxylate-amine ligase|nr:carboxylate-amine ligase [Dictyobacter sp.]